MTALKFKTKLPSRLTVNSIPYPHPLAKGLIVLNRRLKARKRPKWSIPTSRPRSQGVSNLIGRSRKESNRIGRRQKGFVRIARSPNLRRSKWLTSHSLT